MAHVKAHGASVRLPRQPKLVACLAAWAFLASLVCLHRGSALGNCRTADGAARDAGPAAAAASGAATSAAGQPHLQQQQQVGDDWQELRGRSREQIEAAIRAPAGLHGRVQKGGLPANYM